MEDHDEIDNTIQKKQTTPFVHVCTFFLKMVNDDIGCFSFGLSNARCANALTKQIKPYFTFLIRFK